MLGMSDTASVSCEEVGNVIRQIIADEYASERAYKYRDGGEAGMPCLKVIYSQKKSIGSETVRAT
jgi:hypothetical protein